VERVVAHGAAQIPTPRPWRNSIDRRAKPTKNLGAARVAVADSALAKPAPPQLLLRVLLAPLHPRGA
jgi:hypothetical protein